MILLMLKVSTERAFALHNAVNTRGTVHVSFLALPRLHVDKVHEKGLTVKGIRKPQRPR